MSQLSTGGYVRHRDRMVEQSVVQDLRDTLVACRWMVGTTQRPVVDPVSPAGWVTMTTNLTQVLPLAGKRSDGSTTAALVLVDYFPEAVNAEDRDQSRKTEINTFAIDKGLPGESQYMEMGSNMMEQPYVFTMALYAGSDAIASAVMADLKDRYVGRIVRDDKIDLFNFNDPAFDDDSPPVQRMEIDAFRHQQSADQATPWNVNIWYAELHLTDYVDPSSP